MSKIKKETIHAKGIEIGIYTTDFENEYISLTDIARYKSDEPNDVIKKRPVPTHLLCHLRNG